MVGIWHILRALLGQPLSPLGEKGALSDPLWTVGEWAGLLLRAQVDGHGCHKFVHLTVGNFAQDELH